MKNKLRYGIPIIFLFWLMVFATCYTAAPAEPAKASVTLMYTTDMTGETLPCG